MNFNIDDILNTHIQKHRDFEHDTFFEHEMANGATYIVDPEPIWLDRDPIHYDIYDPSRDFYFVDLNLHAGRTYTFLVEAESDSSEPNYNTIRDWVNETVTHPIEGGRDWYDYIDLQNQRNLLHRRVVERLEEEPFLTQTRPKPKVKSYTSDEEIKQFSLENILEGI